MTAKSTTTDLLQTVLPWIGTAIAGPAGVGVAAFLASKLGLQDDSVEVVKQTVTSMIGNPDSLVHIKQLETEYATAQLNAGITLAQLQASVIVEVNKTMQAEAAADHWPTYSWRPYIGFSLGTYINAFWILPLASKSVVVDFAVI